ncbi:JmjC domain-containing protein [Rahnella sp. PAMC 25559]|uniref:JmjC domain-containing protein n=1 Tax=Rahnella sp. PAMC 25559 TaxID=3423225 RepID=UPI003D6704CA
MKTFPNAELKMLLSNRSQFDNPYSYRSGCIEISEKLLDNCAPHLFSNIKGVEDEVKLLKNGNVSRLAPEACVNGDIGHYVIALLLFRSTTIVFNHLEKRISNFYNLYAYFLHNEGLLTHFNVYWSPADSVGAGAHTDDHDVVVIQLTGTKWWKFEHDKIKLSPGDILWIRKGTLHDPITEKDSDSMHLTIGIVKTKMRSPTFSAPTNRPKRAPNRSSLQFIRSIGNTFKSETPSLVFSQNVSIKLFPLGLEFRHGIESLTLSNELMDYYLDIVHFPSRINFRPEVSRAEQWNLMLTFYKKNFPFSIEETDSHA